MVKRINERRQLVRLAEQLGVSRDWHEPDNQEVTVKVHGHDFDNAGFWGRNRDGSLHTYGEGRQELWVEVFKDGQPVAEVNLATLFAIAAGMDD